MSQSLSKDYTGGVEAYPGDTNNVIVQLVSRSRWICGKKRPRTAPANLPTPTVQSLGEETAYLNIVVVRENDEWKVSSYSLDK